MTIIYRTLKHTDYDQMISVWNRSGLPVRPQGRDSREEICSQIKSYPDFFIGAFSDDQLIGLIVASSDGRKGWINRLAITPNYRGNNIARELIDKAEQALQNSGIKIISCLIFKDNHPSINLFESMGYDSSMDVIYLRKPLNDDI